MEGIHLTYRFSRDVPDDNPLLRDVAFNRESMNDGHHVSPFDQGMIFVGLDGIEVRLTQKINEEAFKQTLSRAVRATIGVDLNQRTDDAISLPGQDDGDDWEEMLKGGLQTALESQVIVFEVANVSRTCTHQIVRSRRAAFHQQSQRASWMGDAPNVRCPESVWRNLRARDYFLVAIEAARGAYTSAIIDDVSYQDARFGLLEATTTYIMCEYNVREFLNLYAYRACSMFSWEIVHVVREMGRLLSEAHPWLAPYIKISCEKTHGALDSRPRWNYDHHCTFQGWERVEGQCDFPWARETNRAFRSERHEIGKK